MRIKITGQIIQKPASPKPISNHTVYSALLPRLPKQWGEEAHEKERHFCLFTYSNPNVRYQKDEISFYFSSLDEATLHLIASLEQNPHMHFGLYAFEVTNIEAMPEVEDREEILIRGKVLVTKEDHEPVADKAEMAKYLGYYAENKLKALGLPDPVTFQVFQAIPTSTFYAQKGKSHFDNSVNIPGWHIHATVKGHPKSLRALYQIGFGQNVGTGNGLCWSVD